VYSPWSSFSCSCCMACSGPHAPCVLCWGGTPLLRRRVGGVCCRDDVTGDPSAAHAPPLGTTHRIHSRVSEKMAHRALSCTCHTTAPTSNGPINIIRAAIWFDAPSAFLVFAPDDAILIALRSAEMIYFRGFARASAATGLLRDLSSPLFHYFQMPHFTLQRIKRFVRRGFSSMV